MKQTTIRFLHFAAAVALAAIGCAAMADESEIFVGTGNAVSNERPNILFIIDSSGSMSEDVVTQVPFNPATDWPGTCADDRVYFDTRLELEQPAELQQQQLRAACRIQVQCGAHRHGDRRLLRGRPRGPVARQRPTLARHQRQHRQPTCGSSARPTPASTATA